MSEDGLGFRMSLAMIVTILLRMAGFAGAVVGTGMLLFALVGSSDDGPPTCDGEVMSPGDKCWTQSAGQTDIVSYEDMIRSRESAPDRQEEMLAIGGVCLGGGVVLLLGSRWVIRWGARDARH